MPAGDDDAAPVVVVVANAAAVALVLLGMIANWSVERATSENGRQHEQVETASHPTSFSYLNPPFHLD